jgi:hypothetical protein
MARVFAARWRCALPRNLTNYGACLYSQFETELHGQKFGQLKCLFSVTIGNQLASLDCAMGRGI